MTWINYRHYNAPAPPGFFGGAKCLCEECEAERQREYLTCEKGYHDWDKSDENFWQCFNCGVIVNRSR